MTTDFAGSPSDMSKSADKAPRGLGYSWGTARDTPHRRELWVEIESVDGMQARGIGIGEWDRNGSRCR
jgi:hypothetical protein